MTKKFFVVFAVALAAPLMWAAPLCVDGGTLASYVALGTTGCQIGDKIFSDFTYTNTPLGGAIGVPSTSVTVDTVGPGQTIVGPNYGVQFSTNWAAGPNQSNDAAINFMVSVVGGGPMQIEDAALAQASGVTPNGSATVTELGCGPAPCTPGAWSVLTFQSSTGTQLSADTFFAPTGSIEVAKDISALGNNGSASISIVQDTFSQTAIPEPVSMGLLGGGLALLGLARLRRGVKKG